MVSNSFFCVIIAFFSFLFLENKKKQNQSTTKQSLGSVGILEISESFLEMGSTLISS